MIKFFLVSSIFMTGFCAQMEAQNPIIRNQYSADPTARVFNDTLYLYCSHDIPAPSDYPRKDWFCMEDYHVFSSTNLVDWKDHGVQFSQDDVSWVKHRSYSMWAPDCVHANGKYYFYFPAIAKEALKDEIFGVGIAVSDHPYGPFIPTQQRINNIKGIDPGVFIDDDGQAYIFWAQDGINGAKLKSNMMELNGENKMLLPNGEGTYKEGPFMFKRKGIYYLTYPMQDGKAESLVYSTATTPLGPFTYGGKIMDNIIEPYCWTNHPSIVEYKNQWYIFYHHNDYAPSHEMHRSVRIDSLTFNTDGSIQKVTPTFRGVGITEAEDKIQIDRYSILLGKGANIDFVDDKNHFEGWYVRLSQTDNLVEYHNILFKKKTYKKILLRYRSQKSCDFQLSVGKEVYKCHLKEHKEWKIASINLSQKFIDNKIKNLKLTLTKGDIDIDWLLFK